MTKAWPEVYSEDATLDLALEGYSLARYGDGEMRLMLGGSAVAQAPNSSLAAELRRVALDLSGNCLPCIPNVYQSPRLAWRQQYTQGKFATLWGKGKYGSAFISRPDSAPWIDRPDYWARIRQLWAGKEITLVIGSQRSLRQEELSEAKSVRLIEGPYRDAYSKVNDLEKQIGEPSGPVLLCLGPTATVLAHRLARKGVWALDLGHVGMFMRHAGAYRFGEEALISKKYKKLLQEKHKTTKGWGADGARHVGTIRKFAQQLKVETILDYGCGHGEFARAMAPQRVMEYDPGIPKKAELPKPADLVVCTDVLEHIEPERLELVLAHICYLAERGIWLAISLRKARETLPDGRNAHLIVQSAEWWMSKVKQALKSGWFYDAKLEGDRLLVWCEVL